MGKTRASLTSGPRAAVLVAEPVTAIEADAPSQPSTSGRPFQDSSTRTTTRYLCYFLHRLLDFRIPELKALAGMSGVDDLQWEAPVGGNEVSPFWYVHLPSEAVARQIVNRAVLIRGIIEVWGEGSTFEEMKAAVKAYPAILKASYYAADASFRVMLDSWGFKWSDSQQKQLWKQLEFMPFEGPVDLQAPQHTFWLCCQDKKGHNGLPDLPTRWFFGRQIALADRTWVDRFALPKRAYIGPTSMDPELAFLMTNMAQIHRGSLVLDPYVGTGSMLIAAAARGAYTMGADIDVRVLKLGKYNGSVCTNGQPSDIISNYNQYGLKHPVGLLRMDVHTHPFKQQLTEVLDAIIGDPPYGVRAGGRKSVAKANPVKDRAAHIPSTEPYTLTECLSDLLELAAKLLVVGGRLVFFMPATSEPYREDQAPCHPMLHLVENTKQLLTTRYSRRLVTLQKVRPYDAAVAQQFRKQRTGYVMEIDKIHEIVYAQKQQQQQASRTGSSCSGESGNTGQLMQSLSDLHLNGEHADNGAQLKAVKPPYRSKMC